MKIMYMFSDPDQGPFLVRLNDYNKVADALQFVVGTDVMYFLVEDDGSAPDLDDYQDFIQKDEATAAALPTTPELINTAWMGWNPGTSMWQLRHIGNAHLLRLKRRDGQELELGLDQAELKSLHRLLEQDLLRRFNS